MEDWLVPVREEEATLQPGVDGLAGDAFHALEESLIDGRAAELIDQLVVIDAALAALHLPRRNVLLDLALRLGYRCHVGCCSALHLLPRLACD